jgi:hypothetical protein
LVLISDKQWPDKRILSQLHRSCRRVDRLVHDAALRCALVIDVPSIFLWASRLREEVMHDQCRLYATSGAGFDEVPVNAVTSYVAPAWRPRRLTRC